MTPAWRLAHGRSLALDEPRIIAIINVTPDSFSDGGRFASPRDAALAMQRAIDDGADMLDVGGESTRPGAMRIDAAEQIRRVVPAITAAREAGIACPISVDTTLADVADAALDAGADAVNDVSACTEDPAMLALVARRGCGVVLMHRLRPPAADVYSHQHAAAPVYDHEQGVVGAVREFLSARAAAAIAAGVARDAIVLDPGLGFGKSVEQNFALITGIREIATLGHPLLSAASRKSFIGSATGEADPARRVVGSVAVSVAHALAGLRLFRVHDVREHAEALRVVRSMQVPAASRTSGPI